MNKENLREIVKLVESTISKKLNESSVPPFSNKREAMLAIQDVMDGSMTQKNFINQLAAAKRAGTIDEKNFKLSLGQLRMDARNAGVKLEPIIDRLIDKYHSGSDVFNPNLGESVDGGWKNTFVYRKLDKKKFKVTDFKNYGSYQELFLKSDDGETDEVTLGHPMDKNGFRQTYTVNESKKITEAPLAPVAAPSPIAKPAPIVKPVAPVAPVEQGIDPAWKLDMIDFIGNSFQGQAKQFLYQAKKSNPKATPEQITAMVNDLIQSNQIVELFKNRFLSAIKAVV
jgi:hypothetical protein